MLAACRQRRRPPRLDVSIATGECWDHAFASDELERQLACKDPGGHRARQRIQRSCWNDCKLLHGIEERKLETVDGALSIGEHELCAQCLAMSDEGRKRSLRSVVPPKEEDVVVWKKG